MPSGFLTWCCCFAAIEGTLATSISLSSSLLLRAGSFSLTTLYVSFALANLFCFNIINLFSNLHFFLLYCQISTLSYSAACLFCLYPNGLNPLTDKIILNLTAALAGIAAACMWATAGTLITTYYYEGVTLDTLQGRFASINFLFTLFIHLLSGLLFTGMDSDNVSNESRALFLVLLVVGCIAIIAHYLMLKRRVSLPSPPTPPTPPYQRQTNAKPLCMYSLQTTLQSPTLKSLVPLHILFGLIESLVLSYVTVTFVSQSQGSLIGYGTAIKNLVGAAASTFWSTIGKPHPFLPKGNGQVQNTKNNPPNATKSRQRVILFGLFTYGVCLVLISLLAIVSPTATEPLVLLIFATNGLASSTWSTISAGSMISAWSTRKAKATKQRNDSQTTAAFAGVKFFSGVTTAFGFFVIPILPNVGALVLNITICLICAVVYVRQTKSRLDEEEDIGPGGGGWTAVGEDILDGFDDDEVGDLAVELEMTEL